MHLDLIDCLGEDIDCLQIDGEVEVTLRGFKYQNADLVSSSLITPIPMPVGI
ncbi:MULTISPECIES: hypothetical protein [unclassified Mesorhizobium]|uniref:hypothetical protein n=1 Tax=unclassified Mesorhizobium TaxID=325217 RepID=UPI0015CE785D|nr:MULTISPECIES: hypothetical protein [unclassified Mesorhizobium]